MRMSYNGEKEVDEFLDEFLDSQIGMLCTEEVEYKLDDSFGYNVEKLSRLK